MTSGRIPFHPFSHLGVYESFRNKAFRNKAVAFGAISHYVNQIVTGRLVKYTYGAITCVDFDESDPEHRRRSEKKQLTATGGFALEVFTPILLRVRSIQLDPLPN